MKANAPQRPLAAEHLPSPILVDTPSLFAEMLAALSDQPSVALDTESDSLYRYFHKVCLIQISTRQTDYLVDPLRLPDLRPIGAVLADPGIEKVFHAADNDILALKRSFEFVFVNVFDTMIAARILGRRQVGLAALLNEHFGVRLDKRLQLTDWGHRPLTVEQLNYAHMDTHYLLALRDALEQELRARQRWREAQEAFCVLSHLAYTEKPFDPEGFWRSKRARELRPQELAVLRELYLWRDSQARAMDCPPFRVLTDDMMAHLSRARPTSVADLALHAWQARRFGDAILTAIARGRAAPPPQSPARAQNGSLRPDPATVARYDKLRTWRTWRAAERGVEADVILTNDSLMTIARAAPTTLRELAELGVMGPWKIEEYGAELLEILVAQA